MYRRKCVGSGWFRLYLDGFPDFYPARVVNGEAARFSHCNTEPALSALRRSIYVSLLLIGTVTILLNVAVFLWLDPILRWLQVPYDIYPLMRNYLWIIFWGIVFTFLYNFYAALLRAVGDSVTPLWFLAVSVVLNIGLDLFLILVLDQGIEGAAVATVIAQGTAASGILLYTYKIRPELRLHREDMRFDRSQPERNHFLSPH